MILDLNLQYCLDLNHLATTFSELIELTSPGAKKFFQTSSQNSLNALVKFINPNVQVTVVIEVQFIYYLLDVLKFLLKSVSNNLTLT